jgi:hypothetical protein
MLEALGQFIMVTVCDIACSIAAAILELTIGSGSKK